MLTLLFQPHSTFTLFIIFILLIRISHGQDNDEGYEVCRGTFDCGSMTDLSYPFWGGNRPSFCGQEEYMLTCRDGQNPRIIVEPLEFEISNINLSTKTMSIAAANFCSVGEAANGNERLNQTMFEYINTDGLQNISFFYGCGIVPPSIPDRNRFCGGFYTNNTESLNRELQGCRERIEIPVPEGVMEYVMNGIEALQRIARQGFNITYEYNFLCDQCNLTGGICGTNTTTGFFTCHCDSDHPNPYVCLNRSGTLTLAFSFLLHVLAFASS